jgi:photosystem II stability/assembly factor-like uncharacterized protein
VDGGLLATYGFTLACAATTGTVYDGCGFGDQFWRSTDGGGSWTRASYLFTHDSIHGLALDPVTAGTLYLSAYGAGVFRSTDGGVTWSNPDSLSNTLGSSFVRELVAVPGQAGHLFVGGGNGVWESLDGGSTWSSVSTGLPASFSVRSLALVPGAPLTLYAGSDSAGVWKSADGGASWAPATVGIPTPFIHSLLTSAANPLTVFAGTDSGLYRTTNGGASWAAVRAGLPYGANAGVRALARDELSPQVLFAGLFGSGVFESLDGGVTWTPLFAQSGPPNLAIRSLAVDPVRRTVYAGTDNGVWSASLYATPLAVEPPPRSLSLALGAWPNPARGEPVNVEFVLPQAGAVEVAVFDLAGARVRTLGRFAQATAGTHRLAWDFRRDGGGPIPGGVYFVRLRTPWGERAQRISLVER